MGTLDVFRTKLREEEEKEKNTAPAGGALEALRAGLANYEQTPTQASAPDYDSLLLPKPIFETQTERLTGAQDSRPAPLVRRMEEAIEDQPPPKKTEPVAPELPAPGLGTATPGAAGGGGRGKKNEYELRKEQRAEDRYAAAIQPTSDMYLHPVTAAAADERQKEADAAREKAEKLGKHADEVQTQTTAERVGNTLKSGVLGRAAGDVDAAGVFMENLGGTLATGIYEDELAEVQKRRSALEAQMNSDPAYAKDAEAIWQLEQYDDRIKQLEEVIRANKGTGTELHKVSDELSAEASGAEQKAKEGLGWLGRQAVSAGSSGVNMLIDKAETAAVPGLGLTSLAVRAFGNSAQEARKEGADPKKQMRYGLASAATEVGSEILFDIPKVYGFSGLDDVVENVIKKIAKTPGMEKLFRVGASGLGESLEELVANVIGPGLKSIYDGEKIFSKKHYNKQTVIDTLESMFVAYVLGDIGGAVQVGAEAAADLRLPDPAKVRGNENAAPTGTAKISADTLLAETEEQKTERLLNAKLSVTEAKEGSGKKFDLPSLNKVSFKDAGKILTPILQKLGITGRSYYNQPLEVTFDYTNNGARRSAAHQWNETEGNYQGFVLVQDNLEGLGRNAYPLEMHLDEKPKTTDSHVTEIATLGSVLHTDKGFIPVKMTIKFYDNQAPKLHVVINGDTLVQEAWTQDAHSATGDISAEMTIPEFFALVKGRDEFGKRIPEKVKNQTNRAKETPFDDTKSGFPENVGGTATPDEVSNDTIAPSAQEVKSGQHLPTPEEWGDRTEAPVQAQDQAPAQLPTAEEWAGRTETPESKAAEQEAEERQKAIQLPTVEDETGGGSGPEEAENAQTAATDAPEGEGARADGPSSPEQMSDGGRSANGYAASPGLRKLGVKIAEPITNTIGADVLVAQSKKAAAAQKALDKAIRKLAPTRAERSLAMGLADGTYTEGEGVLYGPNGATIRDVNMNKVRELAEYFRQKNEFKRDRIAEQRRANTDREAAVAEDLLSQADSFKKMSALRMNLNTMKRNMLAWAGRDLGAKINKHLFDPVTQNSAERIRFVNRMLDRVREFHLTKSESEMVQRVIEGTAVQDQVNKLTEEARRKVNAAAESKDFELTAAEYNLTKEERDLARRYHDFLQTKEALATMDADKINAAAKAYSDAYSDFYTAINEFLVMHGYETIGFIEGYAPHMQPENVQSTLGEVLSAFGLDAEVSALPTEIAGQTENYKPGKQWNPYFQHRAGADAMIDAVAGYESYVNYLSNVLYHTDDIQKLRTFIRTLRGMYATEDVKEKLDQAKWIRDKSTEEKADFLRINKMIDEGTELTPEMANNLIEKYVDEQFDKIENQTKHGDVVSVIEDYTNKLAGKQTKLDRALESFVGRTLKIFGTDLSLNFGNRLSSIFGESAVVGNLSSALNQLSQLPAVQAEVGNRYVVQAISDILTGKTAGMDEESDFLTGKKGTDSLLKERSWADSDRKQRHAKITNAMSIPFEAVDTIASKIYVRAKYLQEIRNGATHEEAMRAADDFVERVVGNRIQGSRPMVFESKNAIVKLFSTFQLEVANAWAHISQDLPAEIRAVEKSKGKAAAVGRTAEILMRYGISAFLMNRLTDALYGGTPAPFDLIGYILGGVAAGNGETVNEYLMKLVSDLFGLREDDDDEDGDFDVKAALSETGSLLVGDVPYVRNAASMLGYGDTTLPLPRLDAAVKVPKAAIKTIKDTATEGDYWDAAESALTWIPGGNQLKKTAKGIETVAQKGRYDRSGNLMYPVDTDGAIGKARAAKAIAFGPSSLGATDAYYAAGDRALSDKQTEVYEYLTGIGEDRQEVYDTIMRFRKVAAVKDSDEDGVEKRDVLRKSELSDHAKARLYETLFNKEGGYEDLASLMDYGLSFDDCMDILDRYNAEKYTGDKAGIQASRFAQWVDATYDPEVAERIKNQYQYWTSIPAEASAYEKAAASGTDIETAAEAMEINKNAKGKKDDEGQTIDDTKKVEVIRGVDTLDIGQKEKLALLESMGYKVDGFDRVSRWASLTDYADALEIAAMAKGKKDANGKSVDGSRTLEIMLSIDDMYESPVEKSQMMRAIGLDVSEPIWYTKYSGRDYEAYYYMSDSARNKYHEFCDWMQPSDYARYTESCDEFHNIYDSNGKTTVSRKEQVIEYINALPLTDDQKTALYVAAGYNENLKDDGFKDCPWWNRWQRRTEYYPS